MTGFEKPRMRAAHLLRTLPLATTHVDGESNRLGNLLTGSPVLMGHLRVVGDAAVAVDRDADRERHQLLRFRIDAFGGRRRCRKSSKGFLDALRGETKIFYGHPMPSFSSRKSCRWPTMP
jgi:hypothetical protein